MKMWKKGKRKLMFKQLSRWTIIRNLLIAFFESIFNLTNAWWLIRVRIENVQRIYDENEQIFMESNDSIFKK